LEEFWWIYYFIYYSTNLLLLFVIGLLSTLGERIGPQFFPYLIGVGEEGFFTWEFNFPVPPKILIKTHFYSPGLYYH